MNLQPMKTLIGSVVVLSGALMLGAGQLSQAIALSGKWQDTPVSMRWVGGMFCVVGLAVVSWSLIRKHDAEHLAALGGAILVLAGTAVLAFTKIALTIAHLAGYPDKPIAMIVIGTGLSIGGLAIVCWKVFESNGTERR
jgi:hypothetical protein